MTLELGPARVSEARTMAEMSRDLVEDGLRWRWRTEQIARLVRHPEFEVVVARREGRVVGFAVMQLGHEVAHLILLAVEPSERRSGIGRRLIHWIEEMARTAGVFELSLEVRSQNMIARRFYEQLGYQSVALVPRYYDGRENAVRMVRDLARH
jgi:[ribosomal protein S18]-alanine N-acetyltransferase